MFRSTFQEYIFFLIPNVLFKCKPAFHLFRQNRTFGPVKLTWVCLWTTKSPCCDWFYMQEKLLKVSEGKAGQHSGGEGAQQSGLLMRLPPVLVPRLCHAGVMFVGSDTRQDLAFALLFPGLFTFSLQRSLSLLQVPLAKSCDLSSTCSSGFYFKVSFADRIYSQTPRFPQQDNESAYCFTPALFPCYYIGFSIINYSSLPGWSRVFILLWMEKAWK